MLLRFKLLSVASVAVLLVFVLSFCTQAGAQNPVTLHSFGDGSVANDGAQPSAELIQGADGSFYGTTELGSSTGQVGKAESGEGTAFKITSSGVVTILHSFQDGSVKNDGSAPEAAFVLGSDGNFYSVTVGGGVSGPGTFYQMTPSGQVTILYSFIGDDTPPDGILPRSPVLLASDGNFYGVTSAGGTGTATDSNQGAGIVFKITPAGHETILHDFNDGTVANDGNSPMGGLVEGADGNLYGTTLQGGAAGFGTAYKITPAGQETVLHSFGDGSVQGDGEDPNGSLILGTDGNFYGATVFGGKASGGTIFKMTPDGQITILHSFEDGSVVPDGSGPLAGVIQGSDGNFYGTTGFGGFQNEGTVFKMTPSGQVTILHYFGEGSFPDDGKEPLATVVQGSDGNLYGTTFLGGTAGLGTVFKVVLPTAPPLQLVATPGNGQVSLSWTAPSGTVSSYNIYRSTSPGAEGATPIQTGVTKTSFTDSSVQNNTTYYYEVTAVNAGGESGKSNEASAMPFAPIHFSAGLQMFSSPYAYPGMNLDTLFGYSGVTLAVWSPTTNQYAITPTPPANQISLGQGYWVRFPQAITTTAGGTPADTTTNFDIPLAQGWNMIGDPFLVSIPTANLLFSSGTETFAQATSGASPLIGATVWGYPAGSNAYTQASSLDPEQGYWIFAFSATDVQVPHP